MNRILEKRFLSENVFQLRVEAPLISRERKPGQFVILSLDNDFAERIPLTIADADPAEGTITLVVQRVGGTTIALSRLEAGDKIANLLGPLGRPTDIEKHGRVVAVGGGVGAAPLYPIVQAPQAGRQPLDRHPRRPRPAT